MARSKAAARRSRKRKASVEKSARARALAARLAHAYPGLGVPLKHRNPFELVIAVILSAQCTDEAVNRVTPELFRRYPDARKLAQALPGDIEPIIRSLGLYRVKARSLQGCAQQLVAKFGGQVPSSMDELIQLAGVGRKTANVILGHAFQTAAVIVDTHCRRVSRRLGLTESSDPAKIEADLCRLLPPTEWTGFSHRLILHGRKVCRARKPECSRCELSDLCPSREILAP